MVSGIRDNPPLELPWPRKLSAYFFLQNPTNRSHEDREPFSGGETIRVSELSRETTFLQINALARLTSTIRGMASITLCLQLGFKGKIRIKEVKINSAKPTVIE